MRINNANKAIQEYISRLKVSETINIHFFIRALFDLDSNLQSDFLIDIINVLILDGFTFKIPGVRITPRTRHAILSQSRENKVRKIYGYVKELKSIENEEYYNSNYDTEHLFFKELDFLYPKMSQENLDVLLEKVLKGDKKAKEDFISYNVRLVWLIANKRRNNILEFQDMVIEGTLGVIRAVETYDPSRNCKFSFYASLLIDQQIRNAIRLQTQAVVVPPDVRDYLFKLSEAESEYCAKYGRNPTSKELSDILDVSVRDIERYRVLLNLNNKGLLSITEPIGDDGHTLEDIIADDQDSIENKLHAIVLTEASSYLISLLEPDEQELINWRFGLNGYPRLEIEEIGEQLGLTEKKVKTKQKRILNKLNVLGRREGFDKLDY